MSKNTALQISLLVLLWIVFLVLIPFVGALPTGVFNQPWSHFVIDLLAFILAATAFIAATRLAYSSFSSFYIPVALGFLTQAIDHLIKLIISSSAIGITPAGYNTMSPGVLSVGTLVFGLVLLIGNRVPQRIINKDFISIVLSYFGPIYVFLIWVVALLALNPIFIIPMPHFPGTGLPIWEYLAIITLVITTVLIGKHANYFGRAGKLLIVSLFFLILSELYMSASIQIYDQYFNFSDLFRLLAYLCFSFTLIIKTIPKESSLKTFSFPISRQLLYLLATITGLLGIIIYYNLRTQLTLANLLQQSLNRPQEIIDQSSLLYGFGTFLVLSIVIGTVIFVGMVIIRVLNHFRSLTKTVKSIETGGLGIEYETYADDEFGELAMALDRAVTQADASTRELSQRVKEKTEALGQQMQELEGQNQLLEKTRHDLVIANDSIKQEKVRTDAMLESIGEGIIVVDTSARIQVINKAALAMLSWDNNQVYQKKITEILKIERENGQPVQSDERPVSRSLAIGKNTASDEYLFIRNDGSKFPVFVTSSPILLEGHIIGAIEVFRDITEEKEIDQAKSEFVSLASHQLRTPLTAIGWFTEGLMNESTGPLTPQQHEYLAKIYAGNQRMIKLVNGLLNVSRIELGTFMVDPQPTDLWNILDEVIEEVTPQAQHKNIQIHRNYQPGLPLINLDPQLANIIFQNLVVNAIKYTPDGGSVTVEINQQGDNLQFKVSDTGYGIPAGEQDKIFTKMYRASNIRILIGEGTGLGLYAVKSLLEKTGGKIWFESIENKGTTFYIEIPLSGMKPKGGARRLV
jgi:PAS domain S-box-containing protein